MSIRHVVTSFLTREGRILLFRRSGLVSTYAGLWAGVSGFVESTPPQQAFHEIEEETSYRQEDLELLRTGEPFTFTDEDLDRTWVVHPFLFRLLSEDDPVLDREHVEWQWVEPGDLASREIVPKLDESLARVWPPGRETA
jgi:ADP-ribose pyrophosphatase YjhB (NUDIX family)